VQTLLADVDVTLESATLDEIDLWASEVQLAALVDAPDAEVWLGETGHAQCGGQPGVSDVFAASFWWLDQLGRLAQHGQQVVVRQTLSGSDYGLLDDVTLDPRPDYWASVLFKRLMGSRVLNLTGSETPNTLRMYAHCGEDQGVTVLLIHLDRVHPLTVGVAGWEADTVAVWQLTADGPESTEVRLGHTVLTASPEGELPPLPSEPSWGGEVVLPPLSLTFVQGPALEGGVCADAP
jgi:heparanase 1